jgi:hypothetical protein
MPLLQKGLLFALLSPSLFVAEVGGEEKSLNFCPNTLQTADTN